MPMLSSDNAAAGKAIDGLHQVMEWSLLVLVGLHVAAALTHLFIYRDRVMHRMLPGWLSHGNFRQANSCGSRPN
jgi:cytochrome b561